MNSLSVHDLSGKSILVAGAGVSGPGAIALLTTLGAAITVADNRPEALNSMAQKYAVKTSDVAEAAASIKDFALVVISPGWRPDSPLAAAAAAAAVPIWGDVELAFRVDMSGLLGPARTWLAVTGTNGKTTTTAMLADMLAADGRSALACGNIGIPIPEVLLAEPRVEFLAAEMSSFQLHWAPTLVPTAGVVLNVAEDHLDWHGGMDAYIEAKSAVLKGQTAVCGVDDRIARGLLELSPAQRKIPVTLGSPPPGGLGVVDGWLVDNSDGSNSALIAANEVSPPGPAGVTDALAAAALARAVGVSRGAIAKALHNFSVAPHRCELVAVLDGVRYINDSKATNPHAARTSLLAGGPMVWVAGGLLKGAQVDELVAEVADLLIGVVLIGQDRPILREALYRHAPNVPLIEIETGEDNEASVTTEAKRKLAADAMHRAVVEAKAMAPSGSTVLLAPAAASMDMFVDYMHRGDCFSAAVARLGEGQR